MGLAVAAVVNMLLLLLLMLFRLVAAGVSGLRLRWTRKLHLDTLLKTLGELVLGEATLATTTLADAEDEEDGEDEEADSTNYGSDHDPVEVGVSTRDWEVSDSSVLITGDVDQDNVGHVTSVTPSVTGCHAYVVVLVVEGEADHVSHTCPRHVSPLETIQSRWRAPRGDELLNVVTEDKSVGHDAAIIDVSTRRCPLQDQLRPVHTVSNTDAQVTNLARSDVSCGHSTHLNTGT